MRSAMDLFDFEKSANLKHPTVYISFILQLMRKWGSPAVHEILRTINLFCFNFKTLWGQIILLKEWSHKKFLVLVLMESV